MKAKIGNIEIEGTPEEIKEFVNGQHEVKNEDKTLSNLSSVGTKQNELSLQHERSGSGCGQQASADNIHTQIADEVNKDYNLEDQNGNKNSFIAIRVIGLVLKQTEASWKEKVYPDPRDPRKRVSFRSRQEYLEFIIRCLNKASPCMWYLFSNMLNPDFPDA